MYPVGPCFSIIGGMKRKKLAEGDACKGAEPIRCSPVSTPRYVIRGGVSTRILQLASLHQPPVSHIAFCCCRSTNKPYLFIFTNFGTLFLAVLRREA